MNSKKNAKVLAFAPAFANEDAVRRIGSKLREKFEEVASEPVPDRFTALLDDLEKAQTKSEKSE